MTNDKTNFGHSNGPRVSVNFTSLTHPKEHLTYMARRKKRDLLETFIMTSLRFYFLLVSLIIDS